MSGEQTPCTHPSLLTRKGDNRIGEPWGLSPLATSWACLQAASGLRGCPENFRGPHRPFLPTRTLSEAGVHPGEAPLHTRSTGCDLTVTRPVAFPRSCRLDTPFR